MSDSRSTMSERSGNVGREKLPGNTDVVGSGKSSEFQRPWSWLAGARNPNEVRYAAYLKEQATTFAQLHAAKTQNLTPACFRT